jgi:hypothetical protein
MPGYAEASVTWWLAGIFVVGNVRSKKIFAEICGQGDGRLTNYNETVPVVHTHGHRGAHSEFLHNVPSCGQPNKKDGQFVVETC